MKKSWFWALFRPFLKLSLTLLGIAIDKTTGISTKLNLLICYQSYWRKKNFTSLISKNVKKNHNDFILKYNNVEWALSWDRAEGSKSIQVS